jgi:hypothetical protein
MAVFRGCKANHPPVSEFGADYILYQQHEKYTANYLQIRGGYVKNL